MSNQDDDLKRLTEIRKKISKPHRHINGEPYSELLTVDAIWMVNKLLSVVQQEADAGEVIMNRVREEESRELKDSLERAAKFTQSANILLGRK